MNIDNLIKISDKRKEVKAITLYLNDYRTISRAERSNIYFNMMEMETTQDLQAQYSEHLVGYNLLFKTENIKEPETLESKLCDFHNKNKEDCFEENTFVLGFDNLGSNNLDMRKSNSKCNNNSKNNSKSLSKINIPRLSKINYSNNSNKQSPNMFNTSSNNDGNSICNNNLNNNRKEYIVDYFISDKEENDDNKKLNLSNTEVIKLSNKIDESPDLVFSENKSIKENIVNKDDKEDKDNKKDSYSANFELVPVDTPIIESRYKEDYNNAYDNEYNNVINNNKISNKLNNKNTYDNMRAYSNIERKLNNSSIEEINKDDSKSNSNYINKKHNTEFKFKADHDLSKNNSNLNLLSTQISPIPFNNISNPSFNAANNHFNVNTNNSNNTSNYHTNDKLLNSSSSKVDSNSNINIINKNSTPLLKNNPSMKTKKTINTINSINTKKSENNNTDINDNNSPYNPIRKSIKSISKGKEKSEISNFDKDGCKHRKQSNLMVAKDKCSNKFCKDNTNSLSIEINPNTELCIFYSDYRVVFLFDISQSMISYDFDRQMHLFEKIDKYLREVITQIITIEKNIVDKDFNKTVYSPKLVCSFIVTHSDDECSVLLHEIYLDKNNYKEFLDIVIRKIKRSILDYHGVTINNNNSKRERERNGKDRVNTSDILKILHQSLYILDLLPRRASPIILFFSDACLCCSQIGVYNNYLMQLNRVDVTVHNIVLGSFCQRNMFSLANVPNYSIVRYISEFTGGVFLKENELCSILGINNNNNKYSSHSNNKNIISFGEGYLKEKIDSDKYFNNRVSINNIIDFGNRMTKNNRNSNNDIISDIDNYAKIDNVNSKYNKRKFSLFEEKEDNDTLTTANLNHYNNEINNFHSKFKNNNVLLKHTTIDEVNKNEDHSCVCSSQKQLRGITTNPCGLNDKNENLYEVYCNNCKNSACIFICKKPVKLTNEDVFLEINKDIFEIKKNVQDLGFNFRAIPSLKIAKGLKLVQKEVFEKYTIMIPINRIIETRTRESFKLKKFNTSEYNNKLIMEMEIFPETFLIYEVNAVTDNSLVLSKEKLIKIRIKGSFEIINFLKTCQKRYKEDHPNIVKIVTFIKEIVVSDKLISFFSRIFNFDLDFYSKSFKEDFVNSQKLLLEALGELTIHSWSRFFNVENIEFLISKNYYNVDFVVRKVFHNNDVNNSNNANGVGRNTGNDNYGSNNFSSNGNNDGVNYDNNNGHNNIMSNNHFNNNYINNINTNNTNINTVQDLNNINSNDNSKTAYSYLRKQNQFPSHLSNSQNQNNNINNSNNNNNSIINNPNTTFLNNTTNFNNNSLNDSISFFNNKINQSVIQNIQSTNKNLINNINNLPNSNNNNSYIPEMNDNLTFALMTENEESVIYFNILEQAIAEYADIAFKANPSFKGHEYKHNAMNTSFIKLISKTENYNKKRHLNGFCLMNLVRHYDNLGILYLGFFQCFINLRRRIVKELKEKLSKALENYSYKVNLVSGEKHLVLMLPSNNIHNIKYSIFSYLPSFRLSDNFLSKKNFKFPVYNNYLAKIFVYEIIKQRLIEKFVILNMENNEITLVNRVNVGKNRVMEDAYNNSNNNNNKNKSSCNNCHNNCTSRYNFLLNDNNLDYNSSINTKSTAVIYNIKLSIDEIAIEIHVEPGSGYLYKSQDNELKVYEEKTFFNMLFKYFRDVDKQVFDYLRNSGSLIKEVINNKQKEISDKLMKLPVNSGRCNNNYYGGDSERRGSLNNGLNSVYSVSINGNNHINTPDFTNTKNIENKDNIINNNTNINTDTNHNQNINDSNLNLNSVINNTNTSCNNIQMKEFLQSTSFNNKPTSDYYDIILESTLERADFCIFNNMDPLTSKSNPNIIKTLKTFHSDIELYKNRLSDEKFKFKSEEIVNNLTLFREREYIILKREKEDIEYTYIEKQNIDRFHYLFKDLFYHLTDHYFKDNQNNIFFSKLLGINSILLIRFPAIDRVLNCCNNQKHSSTEIVIHIKFYLIDLNNFSVSSKNSQHIFERNEMFVKLQNELGTPLFMENDEEEYFAHKLHTMVLNNIYAHKKENAINPNLENSFSQATFKHSPRSKTESSCSMSVNHQMNNNMFNNISNNCTKTYDDVSIRSKIVNNTMNSNNNNNTNNNNKDHNKKNSTSIAIKTSNNNVNITFNNNTNHLNNSNTINTNINTNNSNYTQSNNNNINNNANTNTYDYLSTNDSSIKYISFIEKFYDVLYLKNSMFSYVDHLTELNKNNLTSYIINISLNEFINISHYNNKAFINFNFFLDQIYDIFYFSFRHIQDNIYCNFIEEFDKIKNKNKFYNYYNNCNSNVNNNLESSPSDIFVSNNTTKNNNNTNTKDSNKYKANNNHTQSNLKNNINDAKTSLLDNDTNINNISNININYLTQDGPYIQKHAFKDLFIIILTIEDTTLEISEKNTDRLVFKEKINQIIQNSLSKKTQSGEINIQMEVKFVSSVENIYSEIPSNNYNNNNKRIFELHLNSQSIFYEIEENDENLNINHFRKKVPSFIHLNNKDFFIKVPDVHNNIIGKIISQLFQLIVCHEINCCRMLHNNKETDDLVFFDHQKFFRVIENENISNSCLIEKKIFNYSVVDKKKVVNLLENSLSDVIINFRPFNSIVYVVNWDSSDADVIALKEFIKKYLDGNVGDFHNLSNSNSFIGSLNTSFLQPSNLSNLNTLNVLNNMNNLNNSNINNIGNVSSNNQISTNNNINNGNSNNNSHSNISKRKNKDSYFHIFTNKMFSTNVEEFDYLSQYSKNNTNNNNYNNFFFNQINYKRFSFELNGTYIPIFLFFYPVNNSLYINNTNSVNNDNILQINAKWISLDFSKQSILCSKISQLIDSLIKRLNKLILLTELKNTNILDERLIPVIKTECRKGRSSEYNNKNTNEINEECEVIDTNNQNNKEGREKTDTRHEKQRNNYYTRNKQKNSEKTGDNRNNNNKSENVDNNKHPKQTNSPTNKEQNNCNNILNLVTEYSLENVLESRHYSDSNLEEIYAQLIRDARKQLSIQNNTEYFKTSGLVSLSSNDVCIFKICLESESNNSNIGHLTHKSSIIESNRQSRAIKLGLNNSDYISNIENLVENTGIKINMQNHNTSRLVIVVKYYGIKKPSQKILDSMRQFINDKIHLVRIKKYWEFIKQIPQHFLIKLPDDLDELHSKLNETEAFSLFLTENHFLEKNLVTDPSSKTSDKENNVILEQSQVIVDIANNMFEMSKVSWSKIRESICEIGFLDIQILMFSSNILNLNLFSHTVEYFDAYSEMMPNFVDNLKEYLSIIRHGTFHKIMYEEIRNNSNNTNASNIRNSVYDKSEKDVRESIISKNHNLAINNNKFGNHKKIKDSVFLLTCDCVSNICVIIYIKSCVTKNEDVCTLTFDLLKKKDSIDKNENIEDWVINKPEVMNFIYYLLEDINYLSYLLYLRNIPVGKRKLGK